MISHGKPLAGKGIVVTRPAHQAQRLASFIRDAGGNAILFPTIEIREVENPEPLLALIDRLDAFDVAIFVSPNAAEKGMAGSAAVPGAGRLRTRGSAFRHSAQRCVGNQR